MKRFLAPTLLLCGITTLLNACRSTQSPFLFPPAVNIHPWLQIPAQITHICPAGDGSDRLFVTEKQGWVRIIEQGRLLGHLFLC